MILIEDSRRSAYRKSSGFYVLVFACVYDMPDKSWFLKRGLSGNAYILLLLIESDLRGRIHRSEGEGGTFPELSTSIFKFPNLLVV